MRVIVDANIVFSAILNTEGKIGFLLLSSGSSIEYSAPEYMISEVKKYYSKIQTITGKPSEEIDRILTTITKSIHLINEGKVPVGHWIKAEAMVRDIDPKDTPYVAFSDYLGIKIWTGDKALRAGLLKKGYDITITTDELLEVHKKSMAR